MDMSNLLFLVLACSLMTGLIVEALKKMLGELKKPNIVAAVVGVIVGVCIPSGYVIMHQGTFDTVTILNIISIAVLSWICSMVGFDKVKSTLAQLGSK